MTYRLSPTIIRTILIELYHMPWCYNFSQLRTVIQQCLYRLLWTIFIKSTIIIAKCHLKPSILICYNYSNWSIVSSCWSFLTSTDQNHKHLCDMFTMSTPASSASLFISLHQQICMQDIVMHVWWYCQSEV